MLTNTCLNGEVVRLDGAARLVPRWLELVAWPDEVFRFSGECR